MKEVVDAVVDSLKSNDISDASFALLPQHKVVKISQDFFHELTPVLSYKRVAFVDGGNSELIKTGNCSLHFIRVYFNMWGSNKKIKSDKFEFYCLVNSFIEKNKLKYKVKIFNNILNIDESLLCFDSNDDNMSEGKSRFNISKVGEICRRFAELKVCKHIADKENVNFIVLDGSLETNITNEDKIAQELFDSARKKGVELVGFCKTNTVFADNGSNFGFFLDMISPFKQWFYFPVAEDFNIFFAKLNNNSKHVFRIDSLTKNSEVFSLLASNSTDPVFIGYPYGLVDADRFARVSNREKEMLSASLKSKLKDDWKILDINQGSCNAHSILDGV